MKSRLVVRGAFSLHLLHCILEDLFVAHVSLDEMFEAGNHSLRLLVKLKHNGRNSLAKKTENQQQQSQAREM